MESSFFSRGRVVALLALATCLLWGSAFPGIKYGYMLFSVQPEDVPTQILFAGCRFALAGLLVLIFASLARGGKIYLFSPRQWSQIVLLGLTMTTTQYVFFYIGLAHTSGVKASIVNASSTFFSVVLAHFLYPSDRLRPNTVFGCALGFTGVVAVNWGGSLDGGFSFMGEGFLVISCFCMAVAGIYGKGLSQSINPMLMTGWQLSIGGLALIVPGFILGGRLSGFTLASSALLAYLALLSATAFVLYSQLLKYNPVSRITIFNFTIPLFGAVLSAIFLNERLLEWKYLLALILVCGGIWLVTARRA